MDSGDIFKDQIMAVSRISETLRQDLENFQLADNMLDNNPLPAVLSIKSLLFTGKLLFFNLFKGDFQVRTLIA